MNSSFHSLKTMLSSDVMKMIDKGAARDEIMIHVGMLLMLEQLDYSSEPSQEASVHECEDGSSGSGDRIQIRPIVEKAATTAFLYN